MKRAGRWWQGGECDRAGVVLIIVLVVVMMVSFAGFGFLGAMSTEYEATVLRGNLLQAHATLAAAESQVTWLVGLPQLRREQLGGATQNPDLFLGRLVARVSGTGGATEVSTQLLPSGPGPETRDIWRFSAVNSARAADGATTIRFGLSNESARLHPGRVLQWEQASPGAGREALLQLPGVTPVIADSLLDWMDSDETVREFGAESEYYSSLPFPYRCANSVPVDLQELLFVRGITPAILYGSQSTEGLLQSDAAVMPGDPQAVVNAGSELLSGDSAELSMSPDLLAQRSDSGADVRGLAEFLTLWSAESTLRRDGQNKVSLNQTNPQQLQSQLSGLLPAAVIDFLIAARTYGLQSAAVPAAADGLFPIASLAEVIDATVNRPAAAGGPLPSPLRSELPDAGMLFNQLCDVVTTDTQPRTEGRIQLMLADQVVLRAIPGLTAEAAAAIVSGREARTAFETDSLLWLVSGGIMTIEDFRKVFPELTAEGDVFQTELIVFREAGGPMLRRRLVIDGASRPVRRVAFQDTTDQPLPCRREQLMPAAL